MSDSFFSKVTHRTDRERVYNLLVEKEGEIFVVTENRETVKYKPKFLTGSKMVMEPMAGNPPVPKEPVTVTFNIGNEKYFMKLTLEEGRGLAVHLDMQNDLYKLQRRGSFRLNIPQGYTARILITLKNGQPVKEKYDLVDLSAGGFAFEIQAGTEVPFKKDDTIVGQLLVGPDISEIVSGVVRHSRMVGSKASGLARIGIEFTNLKPIVESRIVKVVMDLHREMFSKFKIGSR